ncbi:unnamed protein product, partial [Rotaria sp. Silwood1]
MERAYQGYTVKVCDFGLARTRNETIRQTKSNHTHAYTLPWTAPEILRLEEYLDKSDIYSLGIIFWELASRKIPYYDRQDDVIRAFVLAGDRLKIPKSAPSRFCDVITKCWAQQPNDRPNSSDLIEMIERCIQAQVPLRASSIDIHPNAKWAQNGITVAGGNGDGSETNQLNTPLGLYVEDDQTIYVADWLNHRIVEWKSGATNGKVVAGGNGAHQLNLPEHLIIDKGSDSLIISDYGNRRVVRWPRRNGTRGETIISNISCAGLTMDDNGYLYVVDEGKHEVRRYKIGDTKGTVVAGGNGQGNRLDQLSEPRYVFIDRDHSVYVSDNENHRVMKWKEHAKQGIVVAGGQGQGNSLTQLHEPEGVIVDQLGTVYVADSRNHRIMRWPKGSTQGNVIVGRNGYGAQSNQLASPMGLSFDRHGNL